MLPVVKDVLEADIDRRVGGRGESDAGLADDVLRAAIVITETVSNLRALVGRLWAFQREVGRGMWGRGTNVDVDSLAVAFVPGDNGSDDDKGVAGDEVADAAGAGALRLGLDVEFQGGGEEGEAGQEHQELLV